MPILLKKMMILFLFLLPQFFACGPDGNQISESSNSGGTYQAGLIFPPEIPKVESHDTSVSKLINGGIDCAEVGIATLTFSFFSSNNDPIASGGFPCEEHQAVISDIPAGSGITLEVTAEDKSGIPVLRGEEREITIVADQTTEGDDIILYPVSSPSVAPGEEPKTLVFNWEHIRFPGHTDHYQLQVDPDGDSGFNPVEDEGANHIQGTDFTLTIPVHLTDWINAVYRVVALDAADNVLATSSEIDLLTTVSSEEVIGYFKAGNTDLGDSFGYSVALSSDGSTLAVGALDESSAAVGIDGDGEDNSLVHTGAVYLFARSGGTWRQQAYVKAGNTDGRDFFGQAVALSFDGNTMAVGAPYEDSAATGIGGNEADNSMNDAGAAYVYTRSNGIWRQQAYVKASNPDGDDSGLLGGSGDRFGRAVALSSDGNTLVVGVPYEDSAATGINGNQTDNSMADAGAVYLFRRNNGTWRQQGYVKASNTDGGDGFGESVALSTDGNTMAVGALYEASAARGINGNENDNSMGGSGVVYVFTNGSGIWQQQAYVKASNTDTDDGFGDSVALSDNGDILAVGASGEASAARGINGNENDNSMGGAGAVYLFRRNNGTWRQQGYVKAGNTNGGDGFGNAVALSDNGDILAVGAYGENSGSMGINGDQENNSLPDAGAVYLFRRSNETWQQQAYVKAGNTYAGDWFGNAVALSSDGNTLAVGAWGEDSAARGIGGNENDNSMESAGAVYLY